MAQERKRTVPVRKTKDGEPGAAFALLLGPALARRGPFLQKGSF